MPSGTLQVPCFIFIIIIIVVVVVVVVVEEMNICLMTMERNGKGKN